jgi:hypothetical protein
VLDVTSRIPAAEQIPFLNEDRLLRVSEATRRVSRHLQQFLDGRDMRVEPLPGNWIANLLCEHARMLNRNIEHQDGSADAVLCVRLQGVGSQR